MKKNLLISLLLLVFASCSSDYEFYEESEASEDWVEVGFNISVNVQNSALS